MRRACLILSAVLFLHGAEAFAGAYDRVWFEAQGLLPGSGSGSGFATGHFDLDCDVTQAVDLRCEWMVHVYYDNARDGAYGWGLEVGTYDPVAPGKLMVKEIELFPTPLTDALLLTPLLNNEDGRLITLAGGVTLTFGGAPADVYPLMQFVLSKSKQPDDDQTTDIYAQVGHPEFGHEGYPEEAFGYWSYLQIGMNDPLIAYQHYWPDPRIVHPVFTIRNIPEPATLGLLGLGLLTLIRRRR